MPAPGSALGVLRAATRLAPTDLLALDLAGVAGDEARDAQRLAQGFVVFDQRAGDALADCTRLAGDAAARHGDGHVEPVGHFDQLERLTNDHAAGLTTEELIERAVQVKAEVVSGDFKESFEREILNYGHTFGHAVEIHSKYSLRHGECVSIGMAYIAHLSFELNLISKELLDLHISTLQGLGLPTTYASGEWPELFAAMKLDKKSRGNNLRFVVISDVGKTQRLENPEESALIRAYEKVSQ